MKTKTHPSVLLGAFLAFGLVLSASAALVTVSSTEEWDGISNPHVADGVTITGSGTDVDPWVYNIPNGMTITSTGKIKLWSAAAQDQPIKFLIAGGDLQMDAGAVLNIERYKVRILSRPFILDLSGTNSITGAGQIGPITDRDSTPRDLTIQNVKNVSLASIDLHTENANHGYDDLQTISITASGAVVITGPVDNDDQDSGGDGCGDVTIKASSIDVYTVDARSYRYDGSPSGRGGFNGNVLLQALSPVGNYDPNDTVNNAATNKITIRGAVRTAAFVDPLNRDQYGSVTLQSVVLQLVFGVIDLPADETKTLQVGKIQNGASAGDLFVDVSGSGQTVANVVEWAGTWTAPGGNAPSFTTDPVIGADASNGVAYAQSLVGTASDPDLDPLTYARSVSGPAWLQVAANGTLSGTPGLLDSGTNTWLISVSDGTRFDTATLRISVAAGPRWIDGDVQYPNAVQNAAYTGTLTTNVIYIGSQTLTYSKLTGPAWLSVAADGTLSGTPDPTNVFENVFTVRVTDGTAPQDATVRIFVNGSPRFTVNPFVRASAFVDQGDYSIRNQTLAGAAVDPQDPPNPNTLTWAKLTGPSWLVVAANGALSGTPTAGNLGINTFTVSAANGYPAATATLRINVAASAASAPVEVVAREVWDGFQNPHAADGVTLTGAGTVGDPATYTIPRGLSIYGAGQIYTTDYNIYTAVETEFGALQIKFVLQGDLSLDAQNNAFVTAVRHRNETYGKRNLWFDLNGTNNIVGQGRIVGLGNRVDAATFPYCFDRDTPRVLTITNVNNVSFYDINVQVRNVSFRTRPLLIKANGKLEITSGIDNSDRDQGGDGGNDIEVLANEIDVNGVDTRADRLGKSCGRIRLNALTAPGYATGGNNALTNTLTVRGWLRANNVTSGFYPNQGTVSLEGVVLTLQTNATIQTTNTITLNAGKIQGGLSAGDLFVNYSVVTNAPSYVVNWFVPSLVITPTPPSQVTLTWTGTGYLLQTNTSLTSPSGWGTVPGATSGAVFNVQPGELFYRLKSQ